MVRRATISGRGVPGQCSRSQQPTERSTEQVWTGVDFGGPSCGILAADANEANERWRERRARRPSAQTAPPVDPPAARTPPAAQRVRQPEPAQQNIEPHRIASGRVASRHLASHRIASQRTAFYLLPTSRPSLAASACVSAPAAMDPPGVPFAVAHDLQTFRLLELPPEIVDLLDAPDPPQ